MVRPVPDAGNACSISMHGVEALHTSGLDAECALVSQQQIHWQAPSFKDFLAAANFLLIHHRHDAAARGGARIATLSSSELESRSRLVR